MYVVVGAGLVGCCVARALALRGSRVTVLERAVPGAEASSAAAGILAPRVEAHGDVEARALGIDGLAAWERWLPALPDVGFRRCGALVLGAEPPDAEAERLAGTDLARVAPGLAARAAWWLPSECALDTRRVVTAVRTAAESAGASFVTGQAVAAIEDRVRTEHGAIEGTPIVCAGAWSATLAGLDAVPVRPVRGQLVALRATLDRVVFDGLHYLVPRDDEVVAGTTVEEVGFERGTREEDIRGILAAAGALLPRLRGAQMLRAWSSFRPGTPDRQPIVGRLGPAWIASGHYRNGVLLAPLTAELLCRGILDGAPLPARWNPGRFRREISPA